VEAKHLVKHPDRRVRGALARVFRDFPSHPSAYALAHALWAQGVKLPRVPRGGDGQEVEWVEPDPRRVLEMLRNPKYAGIYVHGRRRTLTEMTPTGEVRKRVVCVAQGDWQTVIYDNHPAYLTVEEYDRNQKKIAMNANRFTPRVPSAPQAGRALLVGLIHCRRCGHRLQVHYRSAGGITYGCQGDRRQRDRGPKGCFRFPADELEAQVLQQLLHAVSPAGVDAARRAGESLGRARAERRQVLVDARDQVRYEADLTRRRLDGVDPANRLVFDTLVAELEEALQAVQAQEAKLAAFDQDEPHAPTPEQQQQLQELGADLERVWFHPRADPRLQKQIVRTLVTHVEVETDILNCVVR